MTILTQPFGDKGWKITFHHDNEEESEFLIENHSLDIVSLTVNSFSPSIFDKHAQLTDEEMEQDYQHAENTAFHNFRSLEFEYKTEFCSVLENNKSDIKDNIHKISWKQKISSDHSFYKVLLAFVAMRD